MKVKYYSEDGHTFDTKNQCAEYETSKEDFELFLKENKDSFVDLLETAIINDVTWYKINDIKDLFLFDHKDDSDETTSNNSFYDIFQIFQNIKRKTPLWITLEDNAPITNKNKISYYQEYIKQLQEEIKEKRDTIKQLKNIDDYIEQNPVENNTKPIETENETNIEEDTENQEEPEFNDD